LIIGPVFGRELVTTPRRGRFYIYRALYPAALMILVCTAWLVLAGTQVVRDIGDMARFGSILFQILAPLQLALVLFFAALLAASSVAQEKDRRTLVLLLMTRLTNSELVLGKLLASLLNGMVMLAAALPIFMLTVLFGGVSFQQVGRVFAVTLATALAAGSLGSTLALWREKTFQALALTALVLFFWLAGWEAVAAGLAGPRPLGISAISLATCFSPLRAIVAAASPALGGASEWAAVGGPSGVFLMVALALAAVLNLIAMARVRVWNPSREVRLRTDAEGAEREGTWDAAAAAPGALAAPFDPARAAQRAETARAGHIDARRTSHSAPAASRRVWDNPVLWREVCTWAYGRKVIAIRVAYLVLVLLAILALQPGWGGWAAARQTDELGTLVPPAARLLVPLFLVSLVIVNASSVTSITSERDGRALDLLLVTDLTPREFLFGKLGGVLWVTKEMVVLPMLLCLSLWRLGGLGLENACYVLGGLAVMNVFVAMLGMHCGMIYANSKVAIGVSLGTVFFLFLGVVTCILMMISFSGSFQVQLAPFLAFILGGGVGLYASLGARNPSAAIAAASLLLPFATFYAITSFLLQYTLAVFLVTAATYGFTTAAMMIPALHEFDFAMGRSAAAEE